MECNKYLSTEPLSFIIVVCCDRGARAPCPPLNPRLIITLIKHLCFVLCCLLRRPWHCADHTFREARPCVSVYCSGPLTIAPPIGNLTHGIWVVSPRLREGKYMKKKERNKKSGRTTRAEEHKWSADRSLRNTVYNKWTVESWRIQQEQDAMISCIDESELILTPATCWQTWIWKWNLQHGLGHGHRPIYLSLSRFLRCAVFIVLTDVFVLK